MFAVQIVQVESGGDQVFFRFGGPTECVGCNCYGKIKCGGSDRSEMDFIRNINTDFYLYTIIFFFFRTQWNLPRRTKFQSPLRKHGHFHIMYFDGHDGREQKYFSSVARLRKTIRNSETRKKNPWKPSFLSLFFWWKTIVYYDYCDLPVS